MARCYQLTEAQSRDWEEGSWPSLALEQEVLDWAWANNVYELIIVVTSTHQIAFALTEQQTRA